MLLGVVVKDAGGSNGIGIAGCDSGAAGEVLGEGLVTSLLEGKGQDGVLNDLLLDTGLTELTAQLGIILNRDTGEVDENEGLRILHLFGNSGHLGLLLLEDACVCMQHFNFTS